MCLRVLALTFICACVVPLGAKPAHWNQFRGPNGDGDAGEAALQEAWEEAGVRKGALDGTAIGSYTYDKTLKAGWSVEIDTLVYPVEVQDLHESFPEADQRKRKWVCPQDAANMVQEPELQSILRDL